MNDNPTNDDAGLDAGEERFLKLYEISIHTTDAIHAKDNSEWTLYVHAKNAKDAKAYVTEFTDVDLEIEVIGPATLD